MSLDPLRRIARLARDAGKKAGVEQISFAVQVDADTGEAKAQLLYGIPAEGAPTPLEDDELAVFNDLAERLQEQTEAERLTEAKEGLRSLLRDPKHGLFDED